MSLNCPLYSLDAITHRILQPTLKDIYEVIQVSTRGVFLRGVWCQKSGPLIVQWESPLQMMSEMSSPPHHCMPTAFLLRYSTLSCSLTAAPSPIIIIFSLQECTQHPFFPCIKLYFITLTINIQPLLSFLFNETLYPNHVCSKKAQMETKGMMRP